MENARTEDLYHAVIEHLQPEYIKDKEYIIITLDATIKSRFKDPAELEWYINSILSNPYFLSRLINDMIILSRLDRGIFPGSRPPINLTNDFRAPVLQHLQYYKQKSLKLQMLVQSGVEICAPVFEFTHSVLHLIDNACKYSQTYGTILVHLSGVGNSGCILTVIDKGEGISSGNRNKAFERNIYVPSTGTRNIALGVGLPIVRSVAHRLDGDAYVLDSSKGCGIQMTLGPVRRD